MTPTLTAAMSWLHESQPKWRKSETCLELFSKIRIPCAEDLRPTLKSKREASNGIFEPYYFCSCIFNISYGNSCKFIIKVNFHFLVIYFYFSCSCVLQCVRKVFLTLLYDSMWPLCTLLLVEVRKRCTDTQCIFSAMLSHSYFPDYISLGSITFHNGVFSFINV